MKIARITIEVKKVKGAWVLTPTVEFWRGAKAEDVKAFKQFYTQQLRKLGIKRPPIFAIKTKGLT